MSLALAALHCTAKWINMALNNFRTHILLRILVLLLLVAGMLYGFFIAHWVVTPVLLLGIIAVAIAELIFYAEKTNREFTSFLQSIKSADFSKYNAIDERGQSFSQFKMALNVIVEQFQQARVEKEANFIFMEMVVEHINTAIIVFDSAGEIKLMNQAAKTLLQQPYLKNINSLRQVNDKLYTHLTERSIHNPILEVNIKEAQLKLSARSTDFSLQGVEHRLVSIQNIKPEIEHTEMGAWEQLLHVLTHEIMNSMTPLSSLSATLKNKADSLLHEFDEETVTDLSEGLNVIARRSNSLIDFVHHYRSLTTLPAPNLHIIKVSDLLDRIVRLQYNELHRRGISLRFIMAQEALTINADAGMIEQVLINLIHNAADALDGRTEPYIEITAKTANNKTIIQVADNGAGIDKDNLDRIFVPFYTTKTNGSGIGLSLSRQIMRQHGGSISVSSTYGYGAVFALEFL